MKNLMAYTEKDLSLSFLMLILWYEHDIDFPTMGNMKMWEHKVPTQVKTIGVEPSLWFYMILLSIVKWAMLIRES